VTRPLFERRRLERSFVRVEARIRAELVGVVDENVDHLLLRDLIEDGRECGQVVHVHPVGTDTVSAELIDPFSGQIIQSLRASQSNQPRSVAQQRSRERAPQEPRRAREQGGPAVEREERTGLKAHKELRPPSMTTLAPVMYDEASEHRKRIAPLYSSTLAMRESGMRALNRVTNSSGWPV
jgi:hypothetical protein